ncbi:MAG: DUF362 domain-containing protein [Candidatus Latescibacteria bacterium]|nr:DUF362 domain-containing protein [Candidatus Latescibacterota bacterium]
MSLEKDYKVRAAHCSHQASADEIYARLKEITAPLKRSWDKIEKARRIGIKVNMQFRTQDVRRIGGRRQELVDDDVLRACLRLLRERSDAEIFALDTSMAPPGQRPGDDFNTKPILDEYGVSYVEAGDPPFARYKVPGGGIMFSEYQLSAALGQADAFVSIAKMKNHGFMGITLCLKNLFGLPPIPPHGRLRTYFHHVIRLSHVLPDLGLIAQPCLNIIDGLTGQARMEWGGEGRIADCLVAGDHIIATDACGSHLMGTDPALDWPTPPFRRDRSPVAVAAQYGFGTTNLDEIDFAINGLVLPVAEFDSAQAEPPETIARLRRTASQQALFYRDNSDRILAEYAGSYVFLQDGEVIWSGAEPHQAGAVQQVAAAKPGQAVWLKLADPDEREGERMQVYEDILAT